MLGIDADVLLYRAAFAAQREIYKIYLVGEEEAGYIATVTGKRAVNKWLEEMGLEAEDVVWESELEVDPPEFAFHSVNHMIAGMCAALKDKDYILYLTGEGNFRQDVLPSYKAGRPPKPALYEEVREYIASRPQTIIVDGEEADDALGKSMMAGTIDVICTIDKDLDMIPGEHYDFVKERRYYVEEEQADEFYYAQLMAGDGTDNICGIKGIGVVTALKRIRNKPELSSKAVAEEEYEKYWGEDWKEAWECNEKLIWIRRK
jgi:hypothetical protein